MCLWVGSQEMLFLAWLIPPHTTPGDSWFAVCFYRWHTRTFLRGTQQFLSHQTCTCTHMSAGTRTHTHTPSTVTGAGGPCHPGSMSYLSGDQQLPEGSFGGAGALSCVPCALNSCSRAPPACSIQVAGRGDSCSPDLSTNAHAPLGRTGVPGRPGPPPTWRSHPSPSSHPLLLPRLTIGGEVCGPRTQVPARQRPCAPCCVMECPLLLGLERGQQTPVWLCWAQNKAKQQHPRLSTI